MLLLHLKTLLRQLILPPALPLLLAIAGLLLLRRHLRLGRALLITGIGSLWLLSTPVVSDALTRLAERYPALSLDRLDGAQAIVILGGGMEHSWSPEYRAPAAGEGLLDKLAYGAYLARRTALPVLVSGARTEAAAMRATLRQNFDLEPRWVDDQAYDTFDNARDTARLLAPDGIHRVILVTQATHMWRSVHEFTAAGLDVSPAPIDMITSEEHHAWDYLPSAHGLQRSYLALYELIGEPVRILLAAVRWRRQ